MKKDLISQELEIEEIENIELEKIEIVDDIEELEDFDFVRENMKVAINQAKKSFEELNLEASSSRNSKDYRVLHEFLTSYINANEKLLDIQSKKTSDKSNDNKSKKITQNLFVGTTKELLELIKSKEYDEKQR